MTEYDISPDEMNAFNEWFHRIVDDTNLNPGCFFRTILRQCRANLLVAFVMELRKSPFAQTTLLGKSTW